MLARQLRELGLRVVSDGRDDSCRVVLTGRLDRSTVGLAVAVIEYEGRCGRRRISVDMSRTDYVDGASMMSLAGVRQQLAVTGATLEVTGLRLDRLSDRLGRAEPRPLRLVSSDD